MKETKRALRRHHASRLKQRLRRRLKAEGWFRTGPLWFRLSPDKLAANLDRYVHLSWNTPQRCSCPLCGNRRRHRKGRARLTLSEIRAESP